MSSEHAEYHHTNTIIIIIIFLCHSVGKNHCTHDKIKDCIRDIYPNERNRTNFYELVCKAGEEICRLCDPNQDPKIVESCFECWHNLSYFPSPSKYSPVCLIGNNSSIAFTMSYTVYNQ